MTASEGHDAEARVHVDRSICIGAGNCARLAPEAFVVDADHVASVVDPSQVPVDRLRLAERSCPTGALFVTEP